MASSSFRKSSCARCKHVNSNCRRDFSSNCSDIISSKVLNSARLRTKSASAACARASDSATLRCMTSVSLLHSSAALLSASMSSSTRCNLMRAEAFNISRFCRSSSARRLKVSPTSCKPTTLCLKEASCTRTSERASSTSSTTTFSFFTSLTMVSCFTCSLAKVRLRPTASFWAAWRAASAASRAPSESLRAAAATRLRRRATISSSVNRSREAAASAAPLCTTRRCRRPSPTRALKPAAWRSRSKL
mmetsp:Transcript_92474/g.260745  ORF Transcript_92474/g.260745 Transcript_92474/m.260745 type:complete len:247 (-) Transcript_92474:83-823(-)